MRKALNMDQTMDPGGARDAAPGPASAAATPAPLPAPLPAEALRRRCDPAALGFADTSELEPPAGLVGQERALEALSLAVEMRARGWNVFVPGAPGSGRHNAVKAQLEGWAKGAPAPPDWVYLHNFAEPWRPNAVRLPAGRGPALADALDAFVEQLGAGLRAVFESDAFRARRQAIDAAFAEVQRDVLRAVGEAAEKEGLLLVPSPQGMALVAAKGGKPMPPEQLRVLPAAERERLEKAGERLGRELSERMQAIPRKDRERREAIRALERETAAMAVDRALEDRLAPFRDVPELAEHFEALREAAIERAGVFLRGPEAEAEAPLDRALNPFRANALVRSDPAGGAPVVTLDQPDLAHLLGRIEHVPHMGAMLTDFTLIRPGALHKANGGWLLLDAERLLTRPLAWETLKRALRAREIAIETPATGAYTMTAVTLEPEPIPLDVKVALFGERETLALLRELDPDFRALFKVEADFDEETPRDDGGELRHCRLVAGIARSEGLRPFDAGACAAVVERAARLTGDAGRLTLRIGPLADLLREADHRAGADGAGTVGAAHVAGAVAAARRRADRIERKLREATLEEVLEIATEGEAVGRVNGLAVLRTGDHVFGRPSRIAATARMGGGEVLDVERESKLGGRLHSKGVLTLTSYLAARYAARAPVSLSASVVFEQSHSEVDGDSASAAELFALLSAIARIPLRQDLAVTGAISSGGGVQAIGGVNEKVEGFFDLCAARGLTGTQGVLIPAANARHLMLREDVVEACAAGRFAVIAIRDADEGMALLTGRPAGARDGARRFPPGSVNAAVEARLIRFAEARAAYVGQMRGGG